MWRIGYVWKFRIWIFTVTAELVDMEFFYIAASYERDKKNEFSKLVEVSKNAKSARLEIK